MERIIGQSQALKDAMEKARLAAQGGARVLLSGETGTGKELLARFIHRAGPRRGKPFVAVNCAGLSAELLESELFGHVKGAFTTALRAHQGLAAAAAGGTLFLDEVAELAPPLQAKLLRFAETGEFRKVGAAQTESADVRIIAASNAALADAVRQKKFREDLYFRLAVLRIALPPLRDRKEDIAPLALHFLQTVSAREGKAFASIAPAALDALLAQDWPGNVRALYNAVYAAVALHDGPVLQRHMLDLPRENAMELLRGAARPQPLWRVQEAAIAAALEFCGGNIPQAARLLEVSPSTLYRRRDAAADRAASS